MVLIVGVTSTLASELAKSYIVYLMGGWLGSSIVGSCGIYVVLGLVFSGIEIIGFTYLELCRV